MRISDWSSDVCSSDLLKVDAINKRRGFSARRSALFAAAMPILSTPFGTVAFLASSTVVSVIFLLLLGFVIAAYNGPDRKCVGQGKRVSVSVDLGGRRITNKKKQNESYTTH